MTLQCSKQIEEICKAANKKFLSYRKMKYEKRIEYVANLTKESNAKYQSNLSLDYVLKILCLHEQENPPIDDGF